MKNKLKALLVALTFILSLFFRPVIASAENFSDNSLKVRLSLEQVEENPDEVKAIVKITNVGIRALEDINITADIPDGMVLKEGSSSTKAIGNLEIGESTTYEFYCTLSKQTTTVPGDDTDNNKPGVSKPSNTVTTKPNGGSTNISNNVNTGDDNTILILSVVIGISLAVIAALVITKKKNIKKILSLFLCFVLTTSLISNWYFANAEENSRSELTVKETINIDGKDYDIRVTVAYLDTSDDVQASGEVLTRGKWISELVTALGLKDNQQVDWDDDFESPFTDIEGHQYEEDILYAYVYSLIDFEADTFRPDEIATREFAAVTSVNGLGFDPILDLVCDDAGDITYIKEVEMAVSLKLINLEGNSFYPTRGLTECEAQYVLEGVRGVLKTQEVSESYTNVVEFVDSVIEVSDNVVYSVNGSTITFDANDEINGLKQDDVFVLPDLTPYKVTNVTISDGKVVVETITPEIEETLDYLDLQVVTTPDMSQFVPEEGVTVVDDNTDVNPNARYSIDTGGSVAVPGELKLNVDKDGFECEVKVKIPKIEARADIDLKGLKTKVNNLSLKVYSEIDISTDLDEYFKLEGPIKIGYIPVNIIPGLMVDIGVRLDYDLSGKLQLVFEVDGAAGLQILNNRFRTINTLQPKINIPSLEASGKIGPEIYAELLFLKKWKLVDLMITPAAAFKGTAEPRPTGLLCLDANIYFALDFEALKDCKLRDWLDLTYSLEIFNEENSPLKKNWHFENFVKVDECTYGIGILRGAISEAGEDNKYIENALIKVRSSSGLLAAEATSDNKGEYKIELNPGTYRISINKDGYIPFVSTETVEVNEEKFLETYLLVGQGLPGETGFAGGRITDALTGGNIAHIQLNIREEWGNKTGEIVKTATTDVFGKYKVELPLGYYTVEMIKDGYITNYYNIYVRSGSSLEQHSTLVPASTEMPAGELRIVLTWGETPTDLDSHLVGPTSNGLERFHIYYSNKEYSENGVKYADLDLDDTTSYGPETTTIYRMNSTGKYNFYIHDYSNGGNYSSTAMSNSGAKVQVYKGDSLVATYNIPTNREGIYWHVFDYDAATNRIIPVNKFVEGIDLISSSYYSVSPEFWDTENKEVQQNEIVDELQEQSQENLEQNEDETVERKAS